jgi:hypothetical protein
MEDKGHLVIGRGQESKNTKKKAKTKPNKRNQNADECVIMIMMEWYGEEQKSNPTNKKRRNPSHPVVHHPDHHQS